MRAALVTAMCILLAGCSSLESIPEGTQILSQTTGLRFAPSSPDGAPLTLGSHSTAISTAQPPDAGPGLNRFEWSLPFSRGKSTVASGPVGAELEKAGGAAAIQALTTPIGEQTLPLPRTELESSLLEERGGETEPKWSEP